METNVLKIIFPDEQGISEIEISYNPNNPRFEIFCKDLLFNLMIKFNYGSYEFNGFNGLTITLHTFNNFMNLWIAEVESIESRAMSFEYGTEMLERLFK